MLITQLHGCILITPSAFRLIPCNLQFLMCTSVCYPQNLLGSLNPTTWHPFHLLSCFHYRMNKIHTSFVLCLFPTTALDIFRLLGIVFFPFNAQLIYKITKITLTIINITLYGTFLMVLKRAKSIFDIKLKKRTAQIKSVLYAHTGTNTKLKLDFHL